MLTAPVPPEEAPGDPLHQRLQRGRAPGGRTVLLCVGMMCGAADRWEFWSQHPATAIPMCAQTKAPVNDAIVNWYSNEKVVSMSLSHQNWRLRAGDRRDGAGRMGAEWVWRAWGTHRPALPRTFPRHHVDPGQSGGLPGEKGSMHLQVRGAP